MERKLLNLSPYLFIIDKKQEQVSLATSLINFLKGHPSPNAEETPEGVCPNCWGKTEYSGQFYEAIKNNNVDVNSANPNIGWVQDYANKHLSGIKLNDQGENQVCNSCKVTYRKTDA